MRGVFVLLGVFLVSACANVVPPTGGLADTVGPRIISHFVDSNQVYTHKHHIEIQFDENIELKQSSKIYYFPGGHLPLKAWTHKHMLRLDFDTSLLFPGLIDFSDAIRDVNNQNVSNSEILLIDPKNELPADSLIVSFLSIFESSETFPFWLEITNSQGVLLRKKKIEKSGNLVFPHLNSFGARLILSRKENGDTLSKKVLLSSNQIQLPLGLPFGDEKVFGQDTSLNAQIIGVGKEKPIGKLFEFREGKWFSCRPITHGEFSVVSGKCSLGFFGPDQGFKTLNLEIKAGKNNLNFDEFLSPSSVKR